jgi:RNA polymerase primary sigma factor
MQAVAMGFDVTMHSGTTWVDVKGNPDNRHRKLIRKLLAIGFKHWPGKGYWK